MSQPTGPTVFSTTSTERSIAARPEHFLTAADHPLLTQYLRCLGNQEIKHVGTTLGLDFAHLNQMPQDQSLLDSVVTSWLRSDDHVRGTPCWESLANALDSTGHSGIASDIRRGMFDKATSD